MTAILLMWRPERHYQEAGTSFPQGEKGQWRHTPGELRDKGNSAAPGLSYNTRAEIRKIILKTKAASPSEKNLVLTKCVNSIFFFVIYLKINVALETGA